MKHVTKKIIANYTELELLEIHGVTDKHNHIQINHIQSLTDQKIKK